MARLKALALESSVPITFGMFSSRRAPDYWRRFFELADETVAAGGQMFIQVHSRSLNVLLSFETTHAVRQAAGVARYPQAAAGGTGSGAAQSRDARAAGGERRSEHAREQERAVGAEPRACELQLAFRARQADAAVSIDRARLRSEQSKDPVEVIIDLALEKHLKQFFMQPLVNENQDHVLEMMRTSALRRDVLGFWRARLADHGLVAADARAESLGA